MIERVAHERFYYDVAHEPLCPVLAKYPICCRSSPPPDAVPPCTTRSGGASSSSVNSGFLKMFRGIFAMCRCTNQHMDVLERHTEILQRNQDIIHNQRDEPLLEFLEELINPPFPDSYASLTQSELAAFDVGVHCAPAPTGSGDGDDEGEANDDEEMEDDE
jgi:hypothetical protein